jgi:hypothetical protein
MYSWPYCPSGWANDVDWVSPHGRWDDSLVFVFDGGVLTAQDQKQIRLRDGELNGYRFVSPDLASSMLRPNGWRRVREALVARDRGTVTYLQDGEPDRRTCPGAPPLYNKLGLAGFFP